MADAPGALTGLKVLDLTTVVMGPYATVVLGDMGAEVIKIESPDGDMSRQIGAARSPGMSALTLNLQRNKRSVALDLASERGREVLDRLIADADILVTNLRPRSRTKLGMTWERLRELNPRLIMCTAQAYGSDSSRRDDPAYDDMVQAASGAAQLAERVDGSPRYAPYVIADKVAGLHIVIGVLGALAHRTRTGCGQHVDVPMVDAMIEFNLIEHFGGHTFDPPEGDFGWARVLVPERTPHRTADGWICIIPYSDENWRDFFRVAGLSEMASDPRFVRVNDRHRHMNELLTAIHRVTPSRTTEEWLALCRDNNIPAASLLDLGDVQHDEYVVERHLVERRTHPSEGGYYATRTPLDFSESPVSFRRHAPQLGADTAAVLGAAGYSEEEIEEMAAERVTLASPVPPGDRASAAVREGIA